MKTIELEIDDRGISVSTDPRRRPKRIDNLLVVSGAPGRRTIEAVGTSTVDQPATPDGTRRAATPFDPLSFDPELAEAMTRYLALSHEGLLASIVGSLLGRRLVRLRWSEWGRVSAKHRRSYLEAVGRYAEVEVNGRLAIHRSFMRWVPFQGPKIEDWAVAERGTDSRPD